MYQVSITASGGGPTLDVPQLFTTPEEARAWVHQLDNRYAAWVAQGLPELPEDDPLCYYEGCDVWMRDLDTGVLYYMDEPDANGVEPWVPNPSWQ